MQSRSTRRVFLATAVLCCCVAALAVAGMATESSHEKSSADAPILIAANINSSGWVETPQQPASELEKKKPTLVPPIEAEPEVDAKTAQLDQKGAIISYEDVAPMALDSAAQGLRAEVEPNGAAPLATPLANDSVSIGNIFPVADLDYWSFVGAAGDRVYAAVETSGDASASQNSELRLIASDGVTVLETDLDDGSLGALSSTIAGAVLPAAGTFYLQVKNNSAASTIRPYHLHFRLQSGVPAAEVEPNDTAATAQPLPANGWILGAHAVAADVDYYSFVAGAGDTVFLSLDLDPERDAVTWNGRLGIGLFGDAGNQLLVVDDASVTSPNSEALFMTVKNAGTYYAYVDTPGATLGSYALSVSVHPATPIGINCTTYPSGVVNLPIGPTNVTTDSIIVVPGSPRIEDVNLSITLNHTLMGDIDAAILSPAGNENSIFTDVAPTAVGGQTQMDIDVDDEAGIPPLFGVHRGPAWQTEANYRLGWLKGENGGGPWTLRLRDDINNANGGTLVSWAITICEPPPPPVCGGVAVTVYSSDFEASDGGFTHSGVLDQWARGLPTAAPITTCNSGTNCWKTNLAGLYNANSNQDLVSPNISLSGLAAPIQVTWAQKFQMETTNFDFMSAQVREPGPVNISTLYQWLDGTMTDTVGSPAVTLNETAGWGLVRRSIDAYANKTIQLRWNITTDGSVQLAGLAVDDVTVTACCTAASCNDGNPCTDDVCGASGCTHVPNAAPCDDGNPCTGPDVCGGGTCHPGANPCDDGNACTNDICGAGGSCSYTPVVCVDGNPCTDDACSPLTGCVFTNNTIPCDDGNVCTLGDACAGGVCVPGPLPTSTSYCTPAGITIPDSGNGVPYPSALTVSGAGPYLCSTRLRVSNIVHSFPDDIDILLSSPAGSPNLIAMSDVGGSNALPAPGVTIVIDDAAANPLPDATALTSGAWKPANYAPADTFPAPAPVPSAATTMSTFTGINPNGTWNLWLVDDATGDLGSTGVWCLELATICAVDADCNDGNVCTNDTCVNGSCQHANNNNPCDDGSLCTSNDTCSGGLCTGTPQNCDDSNACTADGCDGGTGLCTHTPISCDDGNPCTVDFCDPGTGCGHINQCVEFCNTDGVGLPDGATPPTVAIPYPSTITVSGVYGAFSLQGVKLNGITHTFPDDLDMLLAGPTGANAIIVSDVGGSADVTNVNLLLSDAAANPIPDGGPLVSGTFKPTNVNPGTGTEAWPAPAPVPGGGSALAAFTGTNPNGTWSLFSVDDQSTDSGTLGAWCLEVLATCVADVDCDDGSVCTTDRCINSQCVNTPISCDDGNACTADSCNPVTGCQNDAIVCDDLNVCTTDSCNPATGCVFTNNNIPCDDGNACTSGDTCGGGVCSGTPIGSPGEVTGVVFADKSTINWSATAPATSWDGVRGLVSALPVGPGGGDEVCAGGLGAPTVVDGAIPALNQSFWYLFRGANACAPAGTWGNATSGPRVTTTCP